MSNCLFYVTTTKDKASAIAQRNAHCAFAFQQSTEVPRFLFHFELSLSPHSIRVHARSLVRKQSQFRIARIFVIFSSAKKSSINRSKQPKDITSSVRCECVYVFVCDDETLQQHQSPEACENDAIAYRV